MVPMLFEQGFTRI